VDKFIFDHDDFLIFFAAGNNGMSGKGTLLSPGLSKNSVSVAASSNSRSIGDVAYFSSMGPTPDGRTKPDVTAPGFSISSAEAQLEGTSQGNCGVTKKAGTSMATPVTAGTAALVLQYFKDARFWAKYCNRAYTLCAKGAFSPKGALVKALLVHSTVPMTSYVGYQSVPLRNPPDIYQGYGRVNLKNILPLESYLTNLYALFVDQATLKSLTELTYTVKVVSATVPLKVTITWMDPPNPEFAARVLVHDLDLLLVGPDGKTRYGNSEEQVRDEMNNVSTATYVPYRTHCTSQRAGPCVSFLFLSCRVGSG
jgi:subtilisin family serine protease